MKVLGHLAGGYLVARETTKRMDLTKRREIYLLTLGVIAAILPDADAVIHLVRSRSIEFGEDFQHHKWITHTFTFYVLPGMSAYLYAQLTNNRRYSESAIVTMLGACTHILQDMIGSGDGIMWTWPLSRQMDGICLLGVHGREWKEAYTHHPVSWVERILVVLAGAAFLLDLLRWLGVREHLNKY